MIVAVYRKDIPMTGSTIAHLRQQITNEQEAAQQGLYGLAMVASHQAITARMERAVLYIEALYAAGKEQEAQALLFSETFYEASEEAACRNS
jgi:hypothetical protein